MCVYVCVSVCVSVSTIRMMYYRHQVTCEGMIGVRQSSCEPSQISLDTKEKRGSVLGRDSLLSLFEGREILA